MIRLTPDATVDYYSNLIEASTDLEYWKPVSTNVAAGSVLTFSDPAATNYPHRFYRVRPINP